MVVTAKRQRLSADEAKARILEAAEVQLIEGGPRHVRVQALARSLGITDAAIYHHFGTRDELLSSLLRFGGRRLRAEVRRVLQSWDGSTFDLAPMVDEILEVLDDRGYARLAVWLWMTGRESRGKGFFEDFVDVLGAARERHARIHGWACPSEAETRRRTALFAAVLFGEPILGDAARRSVPLPTGKAATGEYRQWLVTTLRTMMLAPE
ncbi:MAG: helix-turn-helix domain-containing protein [Myxococcota bacterium]